MDDIRDEYGGWHDPDLSPKGWVQAVELGLKLKGKGLKPNIVLTSPLKRGVQTASAVGQVLGAEVEVLQYLKERNTYGLLCGLNKSEARGKYPELVEAYEKGEEVLGYESYEFVLKRIRAALEKIKERKEQTIICATHGKFLKAMLKDLFNKPIKDVGKSAIIEIEFKDDKLKIVSMEGVRINNTMAVKITYFVHGATADNEKGASSGWSDIELSKPLGIKQALENKEGVIGKHFDICFCSDLKRAVESAKIVFKGVAPIIQDARLRECNYGDYNGKPSVIVEPMQEKCITERFPGGESYEDVKKRISDFLDFLKKNYDGKSVAIVAHKAPQLALDVLLKNKTWEQTFADDWRKKKAWQPGWNYTLE